MDRLPYDAPMHLTLPPVGTNALPATPPAPPARWTKWWTSPIASVDYAAGSRAHVWHEAVIPAERGLTGARVASLSYAGTTLEGAIRAARLVARTPLQLDVDLRRGGTRSVSVNQAVGVLHDVRAGAYWIAPLMTTMRRGGEWFEAPHTIDGGAFEGEDPVLRAPKVRSATENLVAVVGRDVVITPTRWRDAPDGSRSSRS